MNPVSGNKKGYLLPMVIIYMVIAMIVGTGILLLGSLERAEASKRLSREQAFYLAEAGINYARYQLKQDSSWSGATLTFGTDTITIDEPTPGDTTITVISTGKVKGIIEETVSATFTLGGSSVFSQGLFGASEIYLGGSSWISGYNSGTGATTDAYAGSNSSIYIASSGRIYGDAAVPSTGTIYYPSWSPNAITGNKDTNAASRTLTPVAIPSSLSGIPYTASGSSGLTGSYTITNGIYSASSWQASGITSGSYRFKSFTAHSSSQLTITGAVNIYVEKMLSVTDDADVILSPNTTLAIYLGTPDGDLSVANSATINYNSTPANVAIYSASANDLTLSGNCRVNAAIYAPDAIVNIQGSSQVRGGVVAKKVNLSGNTAIYDDAALRNASLPGNPPGGGGGSDIAFVKWIKSTWAIRKN